MSLIPQKPYLNVTLGQYDIYGVVKISGHELLPNSCNNSRLLTLKLPDVPIVVAGAEVGSREFYICYSIEHGLLFVFETEMAKKTEERYYPQYGRDGNYHTVVDFQRIAWVYTPENERAKDPAVSKYLHFKK